MNSTQLSNEAKEQLNSVLIKSYQTFLDDLRTISDANTIKTIWISSSASQAIFSRIPEQKRLVASKLNRLRCEDFCLIIFV